VLDILELRHDWASFVFTPELFKHVFFRLIPDVVMHTESQDAEQVRDHYDRECISARTYLCLCSIQEVTTFTPGTPSLRQMRLLS
jgi:hypothetical protein